MSLEEQWRELRRSFGFEEPPKPEPVDTLTFVRADPRSPSALRAVRNGWGSLDARLTMPDGTIVNFDHAVVEEVTFDNDFIDATAFGERNKSYIAGYTRFTIRGRLR